VFIGATGVALNGLDNGGALAPNIGIVDDDDGGGAKEKLPVETTGAVDG